MEVRRYIITNGAGEWWNGELWHVSRDHAAAYAWADLPNVLRGAGTGEYHGADIWLDRMTDCKESETAGYYSDDQGHGVDADADALAWIEGVTVEYHPGSLDQLYRDLKAGNVPLSDKLPCFGGLEPTNTLEIWSWDNDRLLIGSCVDDLTMWTRAAWLEPIELELSPVEFKPLDIEFDLQLDIEFDLQLDIEFDLQ